MLGHVHPIETCVEELKAKVKEAQHKYDMLYTDWELLIREQSQAETEINKYKGILLWCAQQVFDGCDVDGGSFQDRMVLLGLLVEVPHSLKPVWFLQAWGDEEDTKMYTLRWEELGKQTLEFNDKA